MSVVQGKPGAELGAADRPRVQRSVLRKGAVMPGDFLEVQARGFNPKLFTGLSTEARETVNAALKSMSDWRNEIADTSQKNGRQVIEKMAAAAKAMGWPEQIVDAMRTQLQSISSLQIKTMDQMMDAWEEQIKSPNAMTASPSAMLAKLKSFPDLGINASWPSTDAMQKAAANPLQFWMQMAEHSQKAWAEMLTLWSKNVRPH
jgi:hypothetical protein